MKLCNRLQEKEGDYNMKITYNAQLLPVLHECDVLIVGGSLLGVASAIELAKESLRVCVIEERTYLGKEISSKLRPWLFLEDIGQLPELLKGVYKSGTYHANQKEFAVKMDHLKQDLEDQLIRNNIKLIYSTLPVDVLQAEGRVMGLVTGNKSGRQIIKCESILDTTETAIVSRLAGATFPSRKKMQQYHRTIEFDGVKNPSIENINIPKDIGIIEDSLSFHKGYRGDNHWFVEFSMELLFEDSLEGYMERETNARHITMELASYLLKNGKGFEDAILSATSYELCGPNTSPISRLKNKEMAENAITIQQRPREDITVDSGDFVGVLKGLFTAQETTDSSNEMTKIYRNPVSVINLGKALARNLLSSKISSELPNTEETPLEVIQGKDLGYSISEPTHFQNGKTVTKVKSPQRQTPVLKTSQVLVVGGGTSGATASYTAAKQGLTTTLLEMNPGLGGTGTIGGVDSYWFGKRNAFAQKNSELVNKMHQKINYKGAKWNIEGKMHALLQEISENGVNLYFNVISIGAVVDKKHVKGVVIATRWGVYTVLADIIIDATGDGDIAAFAGAEHVYGSKKDSLVMWYSLSQYKSPGKTHNNFTSMCDVSNIEDYTRAILSGRRRGRKDDHEHGIYVAPRESRHILGNIVLTLTDQLLQRKWPDVVNIHFSNHDIKGKSGSDWVNMGLIPPNLEIEIPYATLLPKELEGIFVVGKAISATHDALPAIRMQADLENLGGIVAIAAAKAIKDNVKPRDIDIKGLQEILVKERILPKKVLSRQLEHIRYSEEDFDSLINSLSGDQPLYAYSDMRMNEVYRGKIPFVEICCASHKIIPFLERALETTKGRKRILIAQALATYQAPSAVPILIDEINRLIDLEPEGLPARTSKILHAQLPPDQGAMPDAAFLLYSLGIARDIRALEVYKKVISRLEPSEENLRDFYKCTFYYVDAICSGMERLGCKEALPILENLHSFPTLSNQACYQGFQVDYFFERQAMLELAIGRAMARCGSEKGYRILIDYLKDVRTLLSEQAHTELIRLSNENFDKNPIQWNEWLSSQTKLPLVPYTEQLDMYRIDQQNILRDLE